MSPEIPAEFRDRFEKMWKSACCVCDNIREYQPDVILALMHSGWGPVFTAQILWEQTQAEPFPPVARSSLGRGKIDIFSETFNLVGTDMFVGQYSSDINIGKLLAWASSRGDWHAQLWQQVGEVMQSPADPRRILVVDDCIHEGSTAILTLGLLRRVYPQSDVRFLDARGWYRSDYRDIIMSVFLPASELFPDGKAPSNEVQMHLGWVAVGSENNCEDSLSWQPISEDSPDVQALSMYRSASEWVEASRALYAILEQYIRERAAAYAPTQPDTRYSNFSLWASWLVMAGIWLENGISRRQMVQRYGFSSQGAQDNLEKWMEWNYLEPQGHGRGMRYVIPPALQRYVNKVDDPEEVKGDRYWLVPEKLLFGDQLWFATNMEDNEWTRKGVRELLEYGVDYWLDVQIIQEGKTPKEYPRFVQEARALGREVGVQSIAIAIQHPDKDNYLRTRRGRPNRKDYGLILDQIDQHLTEGRVLYISTDGSYLRGILAGCYLARHGQTGETALRVLQERRAMGENGWKRELSSRKARRYVRGWQKGW
jgi:hypothetical protein